jgi:sugar/nucleoside kinase (ribokinase family)
MDVAVVAKLGADARAEAILRRLEQESILPAWVKRDARSPTGASVLISSHDRNTAIVTFRGANTLLEAEDLQDEAFAAGVVYIANLSNESANCFPAIVERAKKNMALWLRQIPVPGSFLLGVRCFSKAWPQSIFGRFTYIDGHFCVITHTPFQSSLGG